MPIGIERWLGVNENASCSTLDERTKVFTPERRALKGLCLSSHSQHSRDKGQTTDHWAWISVLNGVPDPSTAVCFLETFDFLGTTVQSLLKLFSSKGRDRDEFNINSPVWLTGLCSPSAREAGVERPNEHRSSGPA